MTAACAAGIARKCSTPRIIASNFRRNTARTAKRSTLRSSTTMWPSGRLLRRQDRSYAGARARSRAPEGCRTAYAGCRGASLARHAPPPVAPPGWASKKPARPASPPPVARPPEEDSNRMVYAGPTSPAPTPGPTPSEPTQAARDRVKQFVRRTTIRRRHKHEP